VLAGVLAGFIVLETSSCLSPALEVTVSIRNTGSAPLRGLSLDQRGGGGHALVPTVGAGKTVSVQLSNDEHVGISGVDLVDDITGRNYALPPSTFEGSLRGTIDVQASRTGESAPLEGRARCSTDAPGGRQGWTKLTPD
jgi:hypothetical protein